MKDFFPKVVSNLRGLVAWLKGRPEDKSYREISRDVECNQRNLSDVVDELKDALKIDGIPARPLAPKVAEALAEIERALEVLSKYDPSRTKSRPQICVSAMLSVITSFLIPHVLNEAMGPDGFLTKHEVDLEFVPSSATQDTLPDLVDGGIDLLVDNIPIPEAQFETQFGEVLQQFACRGADFGILWNEPDEDLTGIIVSAQKAKTFEEFDADWQRLGEYDVFLFLRPPHPLLLNVLPEPRIQPNPAANRERFARRIGVYSTNQLIEATTMPIRMGDKDTQNRRYAVGHCVCGKPLDGVDPRTGILCREERGSKVLSIPFSRFNVLNGGVRLPTSPATAAWGEFYKELKAAPSIQIYARKADLVVPPETPAHVATKREALAKLMDLIIEAGKDYIHEYRS